MNKVRRVAAMIGLILIFSLYLISFISAIFATEYAPGLFLASLFCTVVIPIMIYAFITVYKWYHKDDNSEVSEQTTDSDIK